MSKIQFAQIAFPLTQINKKQMTDVERVNKALYRPIQSGAAYNGLIPAWNKVVVDLDKESDNHNTYDTLRFMDQWSRKYAFQMNRIAPLLKGANLQETVNNIYKFLYNHFQYKLDDYFQDLRSPSAAWHYRYQGFDCKTFSLLASTILLNLNIAHAFRQVQQKNVMPGTWSHVYVVVPNGKSYYTIDATTHTNKEVSFTKKNDYPMRHRGLASPYINGLGCACQGNSVAQTGLGNPSTLAYSISNFHKFLDVLEKEGISRNVTNKMLQLVRWNVENGIDPNMGDVLKKALQSEQLGLISPVSEINPIGFGNTGIKAPVLTQAYQNTSSSSYGSFGSIASSAAGSFSIAGVSGTQIASAAMGDPLAIAGTAMAVLKKIIPLEKTFGAVFANGFDLSCWGASYSEQKAKEDIQKDIPFAVEWSGIYKSPTTANLDRFQAITQRIIALAQHARKANYAKCTQKGHNLREKAALELRKNIYQEFTNQGFQLIPAGMKTMAMKIPNGFPGIDGGKETIIYADPFESFTVVPPKQVAQNTPVNSANNGASTGKDTAPKEATGTTKSNSTTPILLGGAALLALKLLI